MWGVPSPGWTSSRNASPSVQVRPRSSDVHCSSSRTPARGKLVARGAQRCLRRGDAVGSDRYLGRSEALGDARLELAGQQRVRGLRVTSVEHHGGPQPQRTAHRRGPIGDRARDVLRQLAGEPLKRRGHASVENAGPLTGADRVTSDTKDVCLVTQRFAGERQHEPLRRGRRPERDELEVGLADDPPVGRDRGRCRPDTRGQPVAVDAQRDRSSQPYEMQPAQPRREIARPPGTVDDG